jgi:hypothetical protein
MRNRAYSLINGAEGLVPGRLLGAILLLRGVPVGAAVWPEHIRGRSPCLLRTALSPKDSARSARRLKSSGGSGSLLPRSSSSSSPPVFTT